MKDRIMSQRLTMAAAIVMACACVGMLAVVLQMRGDADAAALQRKRLEALLIESQQTNVELAERNAAAEENLHELASTLNERLDEVQQAAAEEVSDWNPVEFRLVQGADNGPPAVGFTVRMIINNAFGSGLPTLTGESDEQGLARFERVRYGRYNVMITAPWEEYWKREIVLKPGENYSTTVACPLRPPETLEAQIAVEWPEDLSDQPIFTRLELWGAVRVIGEDEWSKSRDAVGRPEWKSGTWSSARSGGSSDSRFLLVAPTGAIHYYDRSRYSRAHPEGTPVSDPLFVASDDPDSPVRVLRWPAEDYAVPNVSFYVPWSSDDRIAWGDGEPMLQDERLLPAKASIGDDELQWRFDEKTPGRIVILPPPVVVAAVRESLAIDEQSLRVIGGDIGPSFVVDEQSLRGTSGRVSDTLRNASRWSILPLPPPLMTSDLVAEER